MKTNLLTLVAAALISVSCASPNAWKDLGDGQGMRGWAGIPLKDTMPLAAAQQQNEQLRQIAQSTRRMERAAQLQALQSYSNPAPWVPIPIGR